MRLGVYVARGKCITRYRLNVHADSKHDTNKSTNKLGYVASRDEAAPLPSVGLLLRTIFRRPLRRYGDKIISATTTTVQSVVWIISTAIGTRLHSAASSEFESNSFALAKSFRRTCTRTYPYVFRLKPI